jgi:eukaryotic-like serine/threonine-protein kinase
MGEVYRSRDTKLKREVAIKVLPAEFSRDPERLRRFRREAELLATLNHPHVAQIYGVEEIPSSTGSAHADEAFCLVLELVEGETLSDRLAHGAIPVDESLEIARQIAEALEAAHGRDIVHRDLKPANIKITPDGHVKVLDFGLAKPIGPDASDVGMSQSPTLASATIPGVILGTAAYMSPEQAKARAADARSDIWAFGCVLYDDERAIDRAKAFEALGIVVDDEQPGAHGLEQVEPQVR